jgi:pimeloyl-ACP methyl ester carboxylesterase
MLRRLILLVFLAALIGVATISVWIPVFIYLPTPLARPAPVAWGLPMANIVTITSGPSDRLFAWWVPPPNKSAPVALIIHGRSANVSTRAPIAAKLSADGFGVLLFDYRGYGLSTGRSNEASLVADSRAAYDWLRRSGVQPSQIVVLGQSLGNAPAAQLSASRPVRALALISPFTSLPGALADRLHLAWLRYLPWPRNRFDVEASARRLHVPVLLVVSRDDGLVPYDNSRKVAASVRDARWLEVDGQRHDGLLAAVAKTGRLSQALKALVSSEPRQ